MFPLKLSWIEQRRLALRSCIARSRAHRQVPEKRPGKALFLQKSCAFASILSFCVVTAVQGQVPSLRTIPDLNPTQQAMADAILKVCPPLAAEREQKGSSAFTAAQNDLIDRCGEMVRNGQRQIHFDETRDALLKLASEEVATQGTNAVETARTQLTNVSARLAALRGGATGLSLQGLAFNMNGKPLPGTMLASLLPSGLSSDVASADEPTIFRQPGSATNGQTLRDTGWGGLVSQSASGSAASADKPALFSRLGIFINGTLTLGDKDTTSKEAGFDFHTLGVTAGVDYRFTDNFVLGAAFGYASTDADIDRSGGGGNLDTDEFSFSLYSIYYVRNFYLAGITSFGWNTFDSSRNITYSLPTVTPQGVPIVTTVNQIAKGSTDGTHFSLGFSAGYDLRSGGVIFGPLARVNYLKLDINKFSERIAGTGPGLGLALAFDDQKVESLTTALGGQASYAISTKLGVFVPQILFEWVHEFLDDSRPTTARYVHDPNRVPINITTDNPDRNFFNLGLGLSAVFRGGRSAFIYYQTALGLKDITKHDVVLGARFAF